MTPGSARELAAQWESLLADEGMAVLTEDALRQGNAEVLRLLVGRPHQASRRRRTPRTLRVTDSAGTTALRHVGDDQDTIRQRLERDAALETWRTALGRGRPSAARRDARAALAAIVAELLDAGAFATAIAAVLDVDRHAVGRLAASSRENVPRPGRE